MRQFWKIALILAACLSLAACSAVESLTQSVGSGSKDKTTTLSKEDWNADSANAQPDIQLQEEEEEEEDRQEEASSEEGEMLDLPQQEETQPEETQPEEETLTAQDLEGTWVYAGGDPGISLVFSASQVFYHSGAESSHLYEGSFQLEGKELTLTLSGPNGEMFSPLFFLEKTGESELSLTTVSGETLPGLQGEDSPLVFQLSGDL